MENSLEKELGDHRGFRYITKMVVKKEDSGKWNVKQTISQSYTDDLENWEERKEDFESSSFTLEKALADVTLLSTLYLEAIEYNLFKDDELSLGEGEYLQ